MKKQAIDWGKYSQDRYIRKDLYPECIFRALQINIKMITKKQLKALSRQFTEEDIQIVNKYIKILKIIYSREWKLKP